MQPERERMRRAERFAAGGAADAGPRRGFRREFLRRQLEALAGLDQEVLLPERMRRASRLARSTRLAPI